jgi:hypothetical protein
MRTLSFFGWLAITLCFAGCAKDDAADPPANTATGIEIEGTWVSDFGTDVITDEAWSSDFGTGPTVSVITDFSNTENVAITRSPDDAEFSPGTYSRIVWTEVSGNSFYNCTVEFGLATEEEAQESEAAPDPSAPEAGGCGDSNFPWTKLSRP